MSFFLIYESSSCGWNIKVGCDIHNHGLTEDLDDHDTLERLNPEVRQFVNEVTKYNMTSMYIIGTLKDRNLRI